MRNQLRPGTFLVDLLSVKKYRPLKDLTWGEAGPEPPWLSELATKQGTGRNAAVNWAPVEGWWRQKGRRSG